jgi:hypothetical protein
MKVLVCGGRDFKDSTLLYKALDEIQPTLIIEGNCRGADRLARLWAISHQVPYQTFKANWDQWGAAAGVMRNQKMLDEGQPDLVVACPGGRGTADMITRTLKAEVRLLRL